jgi:hypothetical protein
MEPVVVVSGTLHRPAPFSPGFRHGGVTFNHFRPGELPLRWWPDCDGELKGYVYLRAPVFRGAPTCEVCFG